MILLKGNMQLIAAFRPPILFLIFGGGKRLRRLWSRRNVLACLLLTGMLSVSPRSTTGRPLGHLEHSNISLRETAERGPAIVAETAGRAEMLVAARWFLAASGRTMVSSAVPGWGPSFIGASALLALAAILLSFLRWRKERSPAAGQPLTNVSHAEYARNALSRTLALLQGTIDALSTEIAVLDEIGIIIATNAAWQRFGDGYGGAGPHCRVGAHYLTACEATTNPSDLGAMAHGLRAVMEGKTQEFRLQYTGRARGELRWIEMRATRMDENSRHVVIAQDDVTAITRAETELRGFAGRLMVVQDAERRRIARDLHDTTTQNLVVALMDTDRVRQQAGQLGSALSGTMEVVSGLISQSIKELRTLSYVLHPPLLEELGLISALKTFIRGFEQRSGIAVSLSLRGDPDRLPSDIETALFRVVQEALTNVQRHSGSARAFVQLSRTAKGVILAITDQGRGIRRLMSENAAVSGGLGVGISGMRFRLEQFGGRLEIRSTGSGTIGKGSGTRVMAYVPIDGRPGLSGEGTKRPTPDLASRNDRTGELAMTAPAATETGSRRDRVTSGPPSDAA